MMNSPTTHPRNLSPDTRIPRTEFKKIELETKRSISRLQLAAFHTLNADTKNR